MDKELFLSLVTKELAGIITKQERELLESFKKETYYQNLYEFLQESGKKSSIEGTSPEFDLEKVKSKVMNYAKRDLSSKKAYEDVRPTKIFKIGNLLRYAATLAVFITVAYLTHHFILLPALMPTPEAYNHLVTKPGEHKKIKLEDGSLITLNGNSEIKFPKSFDKDIRKAYIKGEAFFEVQSDENRPFIVHIDSLRIKVLGTTFNVNAFAEEAIVVSLIEGKVLLEADKFNQPVQLHPQKQITVKKSDFEYDISAFNNTSTVGWKDRIFVFENMPLVQILNQLENSYGVEFSYDLKSIGKCRINAEFNNESIWTIMEGIKYAAGIDYTIDTKNQISLHGMACQ
ncbi:MAG: FecR family protein [Cyclobacteriaceae bacterium]